MRLKMWAAGDLNERVTIQRRTRVKDGVGGSTSTLTTYATVWAHVRPLGGRERPQAERTEASVDHLVVMRNRADVLAEDLLEWRGRQMNIRAIRYEGPGGQWLEIEAELGAAV